MDHSHSCLYCIILSFPCSRVITCWPREKADHLAVLCVMFPSVLFTFPDTADSDIFARVLFSRNFAFWRGFYFRVKIKSSRNDEIILSFTDTGKPCLCRDFLTSQVCLLTLFAKIRFSRKILNLQ